MEGLLPFVVALGLVFALELGDKTQLATISLASRHPWRPVLLGAAAGEVSATVIGAALGGVIAAALPGALLYVKLGGGALLVALGLITLRGHEEDGQERPVEVREGASIALTSFSLMFLAEMGDKTQIAVIVLAGAHAAPVSVFVGASAALIAMAGLSVFVGVQLARRLEENTVRRVAAVLLLAGGGLMIVEALLGA